MKDAAAIIRDAPAFRPPPGRFTPTWWRDIELDTSDPFFVAGLLTRGGMAVVYGESGSGKTFATLDLALHVAAGRDWCGRRVDACPVIYVAAEAGPSITRRVIAWRGHHGVDLTDDIRFGAIMCPVNLLDPQADTPALIRDIAAAEPAVGLIVIDTLSRALAGGDENSSQDMGALVRNVDTIRDATKANVLLVHHCGKDASRGARGHSLLRAATDTEIEIKREEGDQHHRTLRVTKQRDGADTDETRFALSPQVVGNTLCGDPITSCVVEWLDHAETSTKRWTVKGQAKVALDALTDVIARMGTVPSASSHIPLATPCVAENLWRETFYSRALGLENQDSKSKAFRRAAQQLQQSGVVGTWNGLVWVIGCA